MKFALLLSVVLFLCCPTLSKANNDRVDPEKNKTLGIWYGYSPYSNYLFAKTSNAHLSLAGVEYTHTHIDFLQLSFHLSTQVILYGLTDYPENGNSGVRTHRNGFGVTPLSVTLPLSGKLSYPYFSGGIGLLYFKDRFPNRHGVKLNATINAGIGYMIHLNQGIKFDLEYRYHHLSNGDTGRVNPGMDSNLFVATVHLSL